MGAFDYFLQIDGIGGESADAKYKGEIEVESWSWGESNTGAVGGAASGGEAGAGKVQVQGFHFSSRFSKASPALLLACASGQHLKSALLSGRRQKDQQEFLSFQFTDVLVSTYQTGASAGSDVAPIDQVSLSFAKVQVQYEPQNPDGTPGAPVTAGWDLTTNQRL